MDINWIDKLFTCMEQFYGERWTKQFQKKTHAESFTKTQWKSALTGLSYEEIKQALVFYKWEAKNKPHLHAPHQLEFFHTAKRKNYTYEVPLVENRGSPEVAKAALLDIKNKISRKMVNCST